MNEMKKKQRTKHKKVDLNNLFVNTPEQDIPESLRKSVFLDAKKDPAFKRLFGDARLVCNFLNAVLHLDGSDQIQKVEILDKDVALVQASDEIFSVDVRARNGKKQYFDIEIQGRGHGAFFDRAVLYAGIVAAEAHSEALRDYDKAKKNLGKTARYKMPHIICIWVCNFPKKKSKESYREEWALYRKSDIGNKKAIPVSDVIKYIFIKLPRVEACKKTIHPEEFAWYDLIANSERHRESPDTASEFIRDAYERLRVRRTPKEILERQVRDMIPSAMIDDLIDEAVNEERHNQAKKMLDYGFSTKKIAIITGIPLNEVRKMKTSH